MSTTRRAARRSTYLFIAALGVASMSCGGGGGDGGTGPGGGNGATVTRIDVNPTTANIAVGKTATITATPKDVDGVTVTGKTIDWSSSDASIASVSGGVVTGAKPGTATITAAVGTVNGQATVTIFAPVASVELTPATASIVLGGTTTLTATVKDASGNVLTDRTVEWKSDNDLIASVAAGVVTGKSVGVTKIIATVEGKSDTTDVTVTPVPVATIAVTPATQSLVIGGTVQLSATTKDAAGNVLTGRTVEWKSSDESIASVDGNGLVTAHALGTATITATSETKTAQAQITVTVAPVATVAVNPSSVSVKPGATTQLSATVSDASGHVLTGRSISWSSSDETKAKVDENGLVTGVSYGQVTIKATSEGKSGDATVKVSDGIAPDLVGLTITPPQVDVTSGDKTVTIGAHITDGGGSGAAQFAVTVTAPDGPFAGCVDTQLDSGTGADGNWSCSITIPVGADPGNWKLLVLISDAGFASRTYSDADLAAAALPSSFNVVSNWDMTPPVFQSLTAPATVSVASGAQTVTVSAQLTDNVSGVARFDFSATSPSGSQVGCSAVAPASGDMLNGTWSCSFSIPADAEAGSWAITVRATDRAFRYQTYGLQPDGHTITFPVGFPTAITVTR